MFFCLLLFVDTLTSVCKDKKSLKSHKTVEIKVFLIFLLLDVMMLIRIAEPDPDHGGLKKTYKSYRSG
jgi:hypothetical protein